MEFVHVVHESDPDLTAEVAPAQVEVLGKYGWHASSDDAEPGDVDDASSVDHDGSSVDLYTSEEDN